MQTQCNDADLFFHSLKESPPVSIRLNPEKSNPEKDLSKVPWCNLGFYLEQRPSFTLDPLFHAGTYFVQEASSMFSEQFILQARLNENPVTALDLCASPGGKSTHLVSLLHPDSILVSNETIRSRIPALKENMVKWGFPNVIITNNDPNAFAALPGMFDLIVCDAPCSGEGMFRKDTDAISHWSMEHVKHCSERQKRIVQQAWKALKPGGLFIYSTCTLNKEENEEVLQHLQNTGEVSGSLTLNVSGMGNIEVSENPFSIYRFYPHRIRGEGFTIAALIKAETTKTDSRPRSAKNWFPFKLSKQIPAWMEVKNGNMYEHKGRLVFLNDRSVRFINEAGGKLNMVYAGTELAESSGHDFVPMHEWCMSILYRRNSFPEIELDHHNALKYFLGETNFSLTATDGFILFTHQDTPIGFARKTGNRFNNHYPKGWRIRKWLPPG